MTVSPRCAVCGKTNVPLAEVDAWRCCAACASESAVGRVQLLRDRQWLAGAANDHRELAACRAAFSAMGRWARERREARK